MTTRLRELEAGQAFLFPEETPVVQEARGGGFYGRLGGYDGGPWHVGHTDPEVVPVGAGTGIPAKNFWVSQVHREADVELRGRPGAQCYVATIAGEDGVVCMDGALQPAQQEYLDGLVRRTRQHRGELPAETEATRTRPARRRRKEREHVDPAAAHP